MSMFGSNPKPTASLTSGLLARKGHARPAMRPQGYLGMGASPGDDLGWNDMGEEHHAPVQAVHPAPPPVAPVVPVAPPPVLRQRAAIEESFAPEATVRAEAPAPVETPAPVAAPVSAPKPKPLVARAPRPAALPKSKAAFTLRLDTERHLKLRLASAVRHQSAQQLVTEALDHFLESLTEVDVLARQLVGREGKD